MLSRRYPYSRKERFSRKNIHQPLYAVRFLSFLIRPQEHIGPTVPEVSLSESRINFLNYHQRIDGSLLLLTELIHSGLRGVLFKYEQMQRDLAADNENIHHISLRSVIGKDHIDSLLLDQNHLTEDGNRHLAEILAPDVHKLLKKR